MSSRTPILATLVAGAVAAITAPALAQSDAGGIDPAHAAPACEMEDALTIDARDIATPRALAEAVAQSGAQAVAIAGGTFEGAEFAPFAASFAHACFFETRLKGSDWRAADATGIRFVKTDLRDADMRSARLERVVFDGVNLSRADLTGASLVEAQWVGGYWNSDLAGTVFRDADMRRFRFDCQITLDAACGGNEGADFAGADLGGADLSSFGIWGFDRFDGARFDRTFVQPRALAHVGAPELAGPVLLATEYEADGAARAGVSLSPAEVAQVVADNAVAAKDEPSFACAAAASRAETLICGEWEQRLRALDRDLADLYREARNAGVTAAASQRAWLRQRDRCADRDCLADSYRERMDALFAALGDRWALAPDETRTYHEPVLALTEAFRKRELYRRMIPALELAAMQDAALTGREDGSIAAEGSAVGANAHTCGLRVEAASYDPATGWYSAVSSDGIEVPLFRIWGDRLLIRYSGNFGNTPEEAIDFISCGARAAFDDMLDLDGRE